ncbi:hypothetical protein [Pantoea rwandensis]|uniref:Uncharacterized protein n=1 Tax=Pantoea rwandensis TaxID=1076550 RepID=A0A1X1CXD5_9GAMM|nr:hypothetical protein [Pantoea rwandensis]ORM69113.1 hypothetical protein HA51_12645 [Pantoea rwandensis]
MLGTATLLAGAIQQVATGDFSTGIKGNQLTTVGGDAETDITGDAAITVGKALTEKVGQLRQSIAGARQEIIAPVVWIGSQQINVAQLMLDTVELVQQLADQLASHTHPSTGQPTNSKAIAQSGQRATALREKYSPVIG